MPTSAFGAHTITMDKIHIGKSDLALTSFSLNIPEHGYCFAQCELNCALTIIDSPLEPLLLFNPIVERELRVAFKYY